MAEQTTARHRTRAPLGFLIAGLAYVLLRGAILWSAFDQVALPVYELYPMGTIARVLLEPSGLPLARYYDNAGGQLLTALLALPSYLILGPTYLALKLVPALLGLGALALVFFFLRRHFDERTASLGALFFALAPTSLTKYSLVASGNHFENVFFTLFTLFAFYRAHASAHRDRWLVVSGIAAGFAIFVFLGAIIPVALLLLVHLGLRGWRGTARDLALIVPGFAIGIAPLVAVNMQAHGRGMAFLDAKFAGSVRGFDAVLFASRVQAFLVEHLPVAGTYPGFLGMSGRLAGALFLACFVFAYLFALPEALRGMRALGRGLFAPDAAGAGNVAVGGTAAIRRAILVPLVLYLPLTAIAFGLSNLVIGGYGPPMECGGYRYFLPHFAFAILLVAIAAGRLSLSNALVLRAAGVALAGVTLATGLFNLAIVDLGTRDRNRGAHYEGSHFRQAARALLTKSDELAPAEVVRYAEAFPAILRERVYEGLGFYGAMLQSLSGAAERIDLAALLARYPPERHTDLARGFGMFLREPRAQRVGRARLAAWHAQGVARAEQAVEGFALQFNTILSSNLPTELATNRRVLGELPATLQPSFARGFGLLCGRILRRGIESESALIAQTVAALRADLLEPFFSGVGAGLADGADAPGVPPSAWRIVPDSMQVAVNEGFAARLSQIRSDQPPSSG